MKERAMGLIFGALLLFGGSGLLYQISGLGDPITGHAVETSTSQVIIQSYVSLARSDNLSIDGIDFGTITSLPATNQNATSNYNLTNQTEFYITVSTDSNVNVDFCMRAGQLNTSGGSEIGLGNYTWSNSTYNNGTYPYFPGTAFTIAYADAAVDIGPGNSTYMRFWLTVPASQAPGTYNNTVYFQGVQTGTACS